MHLNFSAFNKKEEEEFEDPDGFLIDILMKYGLPEPRVKPFGSGLINSTWKVHTEYANFILQRVNDNVFKNPRDIDFNLRLISSYIKQNHPGYYLITPLDMLSGESLYYSEEQGWFRLMLFVDNSFTIDVVQTPEQAYEAAFQFGQFTGVLSGIDANQLKITIPDFHNLDLRFSQFKDALRYGNEERKKESAAIIDELMERTGIIDDYKAKISNPAFKKRVTHHDTKISNVLFDKNSKGLCVIDLDTVMPGYFFSDVGDMIRTYLSPVSEEEKDFSKIEIRKEFFDAVVNGYREAMKDELTEDELKSFVFAGKFMTYMQALRFLTDYINNDVYYDSKYEGHNFVRAGNQLRLLKEMEKLSEL